MTTDTKHLVALNADIVGFSRLMADDADTTSQAVEELRAAVTDVVRETNGNLINFVGDSFMALFPDPLEAMQAAVRLSLDLEERNAEIPKHRRLQLRIGLDEGEVEHRGEEYFGDALNTAARIQAKAPAGGISLSGRVYRALDEPDLRFRPTGSHRLRNIPETTEIYEYRGLPSDATVTGRSRLSLERPTLLMLPVISQQTTEVVDTMTSAFRSDLLHRLSPIPQLRVIESVATPSFAEGPAHYLLELGVLQVGENLRLYAKLTDVATMNLVSSQKWSTTVGDLFGEIDDMVEAVARMVEIELVIGERAVFYDSLNDPDAVRKMYQAWYLLLLDTPEDWSRARDLLEGVVRDHPDYLYGKVFLAFSNWLGAASEYVSDPEATYDLAYRQAAEVIELDDPTGMGHVIQGAIHVDRGQTEEASDSIDKALRYRPTCDLTHALGGSIQRYLGDWRRSVELIDNAIRLSAFTPPWYATVQASSLFLGKRLDVAGDTAEEVLEHYPDSLEAMLILAAVQAEMGLARRARATAQAARDRFPAIDFERWLEHHPFKDRGVVERWRQSLAEAGLFETD